MTTVEQKVDQKTYLQKYLGGSSGDKKKKKKKKAAKGKGFTIIDDDIDISKLRPLEGDELDLFGEGEDAPQVAGIIDERPEEIRKMEQFNTTTKWRVINQDDGFNSKLKVEEIKTDMKQVEKDNELVFGKMYSDSEDENEKKNDSDPSPPRKQSKAGENSSSNTKGSTKTKQNQSDSDFSPPRKNNKTSERGDSDVSPPKRNKSAETRKESRNKDYDSDLSPPRKGSQRSKERVRKPSRWGHFEEPKEQSRSPGRHRRKCPDSDPSPPRKSQKTKHKTDTSPSRRKSRRDSPQQRNQSPDSDMSPPRRKKPSPNRNDKPKHKGKERSRRKSSDSDPSPPRKKSHKRHDSPNPPGKYRKFSPEQSGKNRSQNASTSRQSRYNGDQYVTQRDRRNSDSPPPTNKKMAKTLEGKQAGLQDAAQLRKENDAHRKREEEAFKKMTDEVSGRNAQVVSRKAKRETSEERQKLVEKQQRQKVLDEKYKLWSRGMKQVQDQESRVQQYIHEAAKPLARGRDDKDLERSLRDVARDGDPMLKYIKERKRERGELGPEKPSYKGNCPPNRFNIRPGYRWDGVDRSNGYEKKYFEQQSKKKAMEEEIYKWSTEDL